MKKKNALSLALLLMALVFTNAPAADAHDHGSHVSNGRKQQRAKSRARRRTAKRRQNTQKQQAMYTCPMHHDIRSKTPGECPKCRMELELEETTAKAK